MAKCHVCENSLVCVTAACPESPSVKRAGFSCVACMFPNLAQEHCQGCWKKRAEAAEAQCAALLHEIQSRHHPTQWEGSDNFPGLMEAVEGHDFGVAVNIFLAAQQVAKSLDKDLCGPDASFRVSHETNIALDAWEKAGGSHDH
jgi:hypothetical protein